MQQKVVWTQLLNVLSGRPVPNALYLQCRSFASLELHAFGGRAFGLPSVSQRSPAPFQGKGVKSPSVHRLAKRRLSTRNAKKNGDDQTCENLSFYQDAAVLLNCSKWLTPTRVQLFQFGLFLLNYFLTSTIR